jgi:hypothetical protein
MPMHIRLNALSSVESEEGGTERRECEAPSRCFIYTTWEHISQTQMIISCPTAGY